MLTWIQWTIVLFEHWMLHKLQRKNETRGGIRLSDPVPSGRSVRACALWSSSYFESSSLNLSLCSGYLFLLSLSYVPWLRFKLKAKGHIYVIYVVGEVGITLQITPLLFPLERWSSYEKKARHIYRCFPWSIHQIYFTRTIQIIRSLISYNHRLHNRLHSKYINWYTYSLSKLPVGNLKQNW